MIINAQFQDTQSVAAAIQSLQEYGLGPGQIEIFSAKPVALAPGILDRPSRMSLFAVLGAIAAGTFSTWFVFYTQLDYPLVTGGMPLTSGWATGVVTFEFTMVGAILATMFMFLWEGGLPRRSSRPAPHIPDDAIILQAECDNELADSVTSTLQRMGSLRTERVEPAT